MTPEEHARRSELWQRHVVRGEGLDTVVADLAAEFDVDEETLQDDVDTINEWLPRLDITRDVGCISLLAEVRSNRQHLHQLADQAREADERVEERKVHEELNRSLNLERRLREEDTKTSLSYDNLTLDEQFD